MSLPPRLPSALSPTPSLKDTEDTVSLPGPKKDFGHFSEMKIIMLYKVGLGKNKIKENKDGNSSWNLTEERVLDSLSHQ